MKNGKIRKSKYIYKVLYKIDNMVGGIWVNSLMWSLSALRTLPHTGPIWWLSTDVSKIMVALLYFYTSLQVKCDFWT